MNHPSYRKIFDEQEIVNRYDSQIRDIRLLGFRWKGRKKMATQKELDNWFTYHPPAGSQPARYVMIREAALSFATVLNKCCVDSADKGAAFRKLRECVMTANASIALEDPPMSFPADVAAQEGGR